MIRDGLVACDNNSGMSRLWVVLLSFH